LRGAKLTKNLAAVTGAGNKQKETAPKAKPTNRHGKKQQNTRNKNKIN
jgi:hypothetical protein